MSSYAVIVLYFRAGEVLGSTLDAVLGQTAPPEEVLVVDNASGDGTAPRLVQERPGVRLLTLNANEGYAGGMNRGVDALLSDAPRILFLTHEAELALDAAQELVGALSTSEAVACGPLLRRHRDGSIWSAGGTLSSRGATAHLQQPPTPEAKAYEVDWLDGAALMLDRAAFEAVGRFDERFFLYWEDVDISIRMREHGPVICAPLAQAVQETGTTPPYYAARNRILFWRSRRSRVNAVKAVSGEAEAALRDIVRRRPRVRDAAGRAFGIVDGLSGRLHRDHAAIRSR